MRLWPQRAGRGACFRPRLTGRGICSAPWPAGRRTSGQARAGVNGTGRKLRGKHESRIARGICTCSHTFVCNVRRRVTLCLPPTAILPRAVGPDPLRMWVRPHRAPARRRATRAYMSFFDDMPTEEPEPRVHHPWDPPETEFPAVVPSGPLMLRRAERAAVAITGISAYSAGFEIFVTARFRPGAGGTSGSGDRVPGGPEPAPPRPGGPSASGCSSPTAPGSSASTGAPGCPAMTSPPVPSCGRSSAAAARGPASGAGGHGRCRPLGRWGSSASGRRSGSPRPVPGSTPGSSWIRRAAASGSGPRRKAERLSPDLGSAPAGAHIDPDGNLIQFGSPMQ